MKLTQKLALFATFACYGPAIRIFGELRIVEIVLLALLVFNLGAALRSIGRYEKRLIGLFLLAAMAHVIADSITDASIEGTLKRSGTYILLSLLLLVLTWLARRNPERMLWMLAGYCASYALVFVFDVKTPSAGYQEAPWRLGLGMAATLGVTLFTATQPRFRLFGALALLALGGIHWALDARALSALAIVTALLLGWAEVRPSPAPSRFRLLFVVRYVGLAVLGVVLLRMGLEYATEHQVFAEPMQKKMEMQLANPYGLLGAGRPEFVAALSAISKSPLWGHGSTNVDPDVYYLYAKASAETYAYIGAYKGVLEEQLAREWTIGTPSHSHLLGAWADAGIVASLCWFAVLGLCVYVIVRMTRWRHPLVPLIVLIALATVWDVLFSPGPTRVEMAFRLLVLIHAANMLRAFDREQERGVSWPTTA